MTKNLLIIVSLLFSIAPHAAAAKSVEQCTLIKNLETQEVVYERGENCDERFSPASTFKLPLAIIGFEERVLIDPNSPAIPYDPSYSAWLKSWKNTTTPTTWLRDSVIWYSRLITEELGAQKFQNYVERFNYGNMDLRGDKGKNNGLTHAWLGSSLQISPREQTVFLENFLQQKLHLSFQTHENFGQIMPRYNTGQNTPVWGKTGTAIIKTANGASTNAQNGWFIGWIVRDGQTYVFAQLITETPPRTGSAGPNTRSGFLKNIDALINK